MTAIAASVIAVPVAWATVAVAENPNHPGAVTLPNADQFYDKDLTLAEISAASQGRPGQALPPCPAQPVVVKLKTAGLPVGPCDPLPEEGQQIVLPDDEQQPEAELRTCAGVFLRTTTPGSVLRLVGPCGVGVAISEVDLLKRISAAACARVTWVPSAGTEPRTETVCTSDPVDPSKPRLVAGVDR